MKCCSRTAYEVLNSRTDAADDSLQIAVPNNAIPNIKWARL
jgi:hypothetical protein